LSYDLKNEIEDLESNNPRTVSVPNLVFGIPQTMIRFNKEEIEIISYNDPEVIFEEITSTPFGVSVSATVKGEPRSKTTKSQYIHHVNRIKEAIVEGEFYEMNYCIEYCYATEHFNPLTVFEHLNIISPMPFSALLKFGTKYLICASPERFLKKEGNKIISQPIKGTIKRSFEKSEDEKLKNALFQSEKERAENLMIVDLVRNDLARSSLPGSVRVEELFGIYTFKRIHQMISTVTSSFDPNKNISAIIKNAFPMGSMTGAPKIRVMEEIEALENSARGIYSGSVGFFTPEGDFDLNVVIRSLIFDGATNKVSFHVGSAITYDSDPHYEYNECLLKAETLFEALIS
jgi:para-aminobenzoate synthetase component 1